MENKRYCVRYFRIHTDYSDFSPLSHDEQALATLEEMYQEDDDKRLSMHFTHEEALKELDKFHCSYDTTKGRINGYGSMEIEMYVISEMVEEDGEWYIERDLERAKFLFEVE